MIQLSDDDLPMRFRKLADLHSSVISPNGKWVGGYYSVGDESAGALFYIVFINLETDERIELGPYPESLVFLTSVVCMTDTGILYGIEANGGIKVFDVNEKDYYVLEVPGMNTAAIGISNISADGSFWVGWDQVDGYYRPFVVENGTATMLPLPEENFRGPYEDGEINLMARGLLRRPLHHLRYHVGQQGLRYDLLGRRPERTFRG